LATVDHAAAIFVERVVRPGLSAPRGLPRLNALFENWLEYARREVFRGGCFFAAVSAEFDGRPGPVRERIKAHMKEWMNLLSGAVRRAQQEGHLRADVEPAQLAFEAHSIASGANWAFQLFGDAAAFQRAKHAIQARLEPLTVGNGRLPGRQAAPRRPQKRSSD